MTTRRPTVSVITPTYNRAGLIRETLDSVLAQKGDVRLQLIVVDDGSTDGTVEVLDAYRHEAVIRRHANMGESASVNVGLTLATADIIGVVNSDDPILPGLLAAAVESLTADPKLVAVYPDWRRIDADGHAIGDVHPPDYDYAHMLARHHCLPGPGAFFRRSLIDRIGGRSTTHQYCSDFEFWLRAGRCGPMARIPRVLATHREHNGMASRHKAGRRIAAEHIRLATEALAAPDVPTAARERRREAMAWAHIVAASRCGHHPARRVALLANAALWHAPSVAELARGAVRRGGGPAGAIRHVAARLAAGSLPEEAVRDRRAASPTTRPAP